MIDFLNKNNDSLKYIGLIKLKAEKTIHSEKIHKSKMQQN